MKNRGRVILNICLVLMVACAWIAMILFGAGDLAAGGIRSLRYFTVISNLMVGLGAVLWLISARRNSEADERIERFKYVAATSVFLTFTTVMVFLGPLYGYPNMFRGPNLFLHLIIPLAAIAEIIFMEEMKFSRRDNYIALIPLLIYAVLYLSNNLINGIGEWPETNDWYLFLTWGWPVAILIFAVMILVTWLLGLLLRKLQRAASENDDTNPRSRE